MRYGFSFFFPFFEWLDHHFYFWTTWDKIDQWLVKFKSPEITCGLTLWTRLPT
jgi:hypothetical protein